MSRFLTVFLVAVLSALAAAQVKLKLEFPSAGPRQVWVGSSAPMGKMPTTARVEAASADFAPDAFGPSDRLFILDEGTGNLASKRMDEVVGGWKLAEADFSRIGIVRVRVEHKGEPVSAASIVLKAAGVAQNAVLDPSSNGEALFFGVAPGSIQAVVSYKTLSGETPEPIKQSTDAALKRSRPEVLIVVSIQDDVATVASQGTTKASDVKAGDSKGGGPPPAPGDGGSLFGRLVSFLLAVAVAAAAVFFLLKWLKANQDKVQSKLTSMGVEVPQSGDGAPGPDPAPNTPIAPPPPSQILLDDATPTPLGAAIPAPAPMTASTGQPRLVSASGDELPLDEGTLSIGREAGLGLSLINESTVSRNHAEIVRQGASVWVRDLGSTNGTFLNGVQVSGEAELKPGDQVQFGAVRFRFEG